MYCLAILIILALVVFYFSDVTFIRGNSKELKKSTKKEKSIKFNK